MYGDGAGAFGNRRNLGNPGPVTGIAIGDFNGDIFPDVAASTPTGVAVWANRLENAPMPSSATKTPPRQRPEASRTRRLKKADFEVDFFFIDEVKFFPVRLEPEKVAKC